MASRQKAESSTADGSKQTAGGRPQEADPYVELVFSPFCLLHSAFFLLPTAVCCLPSGYGRLPSATNRQTLLQNFFLRPLDRHAVSFPVFIDGPVFEHVVPLIAHRFDFQSGLFG